MGKIHTILAFTFGFAFATIFYSVVNFQQSLPLDELNNLDFLTIRNDVNPKSPAVNSENYYGEEHLNTHSVDASGTNHNKKDANESEGAVEKNKVRVLDADASICSILNSQTPMKIWSKNIDKIFPASRHAQDKPDEFVWHDFTAMLLNYMTPQRLSMSVKNLPNGYWDQVGNVMDIAWKRYQYLQNNDGRVDKKDKSAPRKVSILVMGGSVTMGVQCAENPVQQTSRFARRNCAWPTRLQHFFDALFPDIVELNMITLGGTNTESAITIWDYSLYPDTVPHPDIIVHAYSTNDMHVLSELDAKKRGVTLEDMILEVNQNFIRKVLGQGTTLQDQCNRPTPLLFYFDDYVGNEQRELLKTNAFSKSIHTLSSYYGFGYVSYADAVRHLVYGDTNENWFSPHGWPERQVHPGMGMHITSAWVMAFNFLQTATAFCDRSDYLEADTHFSSGGSPQMEGELVYAPSNGLPELRQKQGDKKLEGAPHLLPKVGLPPELNMNLTLDVISTEWKNAIKSTPAFDPSQCQNTVLLADTNYHYRPCLFSWVSGLEKGFDKAKNLMKRMKPVLKSNDGWEASDDNGKMGFVATKTEASFELEFHDVKQVIRTLNFMVMTSYGEKWEGSQILVEPLIERKDGSKTENAKTMHIMGYHDKHTSETYNYKLDLGDDMGIMPKDTLRIRVTLVGGMTFKFMGMAICDH